MNYFVDFACRSLNKVGEEQIGSRWHWLFFLEPTDARCTKEQGKGESE